MKTTTRSAKRFTIGRAAFAKISAVEGIQITAAMRADFNEFDRRRLSATERRKAIAAKYAKVR